MMVLPVFLSLSYTCTYLFKTLIRITGNILSFVLDIQVAFMIRIPKHSFFPILKPEFIMPKKSLFVDSKL